MAQEKYEELKVVYIPKNFESGVNILGNTYSNARVIEAGIMAIIPIIIVFIIMPFAGVEMATTTKLTIVVTISGGLGLLGISGINGDSCLGFIKTLLTYVKNKRIAYYNPRIKKEAVSFINQTNEIDVLPRDKVIALYKKYKETFDEKERENIVKQQEKVKELGLGIYFEDDIGVLDKPIEFMSKKEYKEYIKEQKKEAKKNKGIIKLKK